MNNKKKIFVTLLMFIATFAGLLTANFLVDRQNLEKTLKVSAEGNWGLSFQEEGKAPVGNADIEYLKKFDSWFVGEENEEKTIYLTFDSGYENGYTSDILDVLKEENVPAAFFVVGNYIKDNPQLILRMKEEGHIVGNHTMTHPDMSKIEEFKAFEEEITLLEKEYEKITGEKMKKYYRPPQGKYSENNLKNAKELGYTTVFWSLAYVDWLENQQPNREEALNILNKRIHNGAIVLLHSTSKTNSQILKELIQGWKKEGYSFKSLDEL